MRSRREEYTKRFEELTKQEIKNYNDSLLNTHMALEEFRVKLKDSVDLYASQVAHLSSTIKKVESENRDLKSEIASLSKKLESQVHDFNNLDRKSIEEDRQRAQWEKSFEEELSRLQDFMHSLRDTHLNETIALKHSVNNIATNVERLYRKSLSDNDVLKKEILSLPSEAEKVKAELLKKVSETAVDNSGIQRELDKIKKKSVIQESMNEYFHIQLDRLKTRDKE